MKGIILDIKDKDVAILMDNGEIQKIKNKNYKIGETVHFEEKSKSGFRFVRLAAGLAAAMAIFTIGAFAYSTPIGYVSLDINPSVEFSLNMFDRVLDVTGKNDDGKEFVSSLKLNNKPIGDAIDILMAELIKERYIVDDGDAGIVITTSYKDMDDAERLAKKLRERVRTCINDIDEENQDAEDNEIEIDENQDDDITEVDAVEDEEEKDDGDSKFSIHAEAVGRVRVDEAKDLGVTPGKLNLVEKLIESAENPDNYNKEEWLNKPVKEINKMIKENRQAKIDKEKENRERDRGDDQESSDNQKSRKGNGPK